MCSLISQRSWPRTAQSLTAPSVPTWQPSFVLVPLFGSRPAYCGLAQAKFSSFTQPSRWVCMADRRTNNLSATSDWSVIALMSKRLRLPPVASI